MCRCMHMCRFTRETAACALNTSETSDSAQQSTQQESAPHLTSGPLLDRRATSPEGREYYYHATSGETSWTLPAA